MKQKLSLRNILSVGFAAACSLFLASCTADNLAPGPDQDLASLPLTISASINAPVQTRIVKDFEYGKDDFDSSDDIILWTFPEKDPTNADASFNERISYSTPNHWKPSTFSWESLGIPTADSPRCFLATYSGNKVDQGELDKVSYQVVKDQKNSSSYTESDLLTAFARYESLPAGGVVSLSFRHALARLCITLVDGSKKKELDLTNTAVTIRNVKMSYKLNYQSQILPDPDSKTDNIFCYHYDAVPGSFYAVLPPQELNDQGLDLLITVGGRTLQHHVTMKTDRLEGGKDYPITINMADRKDANEKAQEFNILQEKRMEKEMLTYYLLNESSSKSFYPTRVIGTFTNPNDPNTAIDLGAEAYNEYLLFDPQKMVEADISKGIYVVYTIKVDNVESLPCKINLANLFTGARDLRYFRSVKAELDEWTVKEQTVSHGSINANESFNLTNYDILPSHFSIDPLAATTVSGSKAITANDVTLENNNGYIIVRVKKAIPIFSELTFTWTGDLTFGNDYGKYTYQLNDFKVKLVHIE